MITTPYGEIEEGLLEDFCRIAGYRYTNNEFIVLKEEIDYWQLTNPSSTVEEKKWSKKPGWLPVRDYNFEYALYETACYKKMAMAIDNSKVKTKAFDIKAALIFASEKLFDSSGKPVYLPEILASKHDAFYDPKTKPPKSYNKILAEMKEQFNYLKNPNENN